MLGMSAVVFVVEWLFLFISLGGLTCVGGW